MNARFPKMGFASWWKANSWLIIVIQIISLGISLIWHMNYWWYPDQIYLGSVWIQVSSTGGGTGADTVLVLMSPMMCSASLSAWYMRSISSRRCACSADSSIRLFWSPDEYRYASSSEWMNSFAWDTNTVRETRTPETPTNWQLLVALERHKTLIK